MIRLQIHRLTGLLIPHLTRLLIHRLIGLLIHRLTRLLIRRLTCLLIWRLIPHMIRSLGITTLTSAKTAKQYNQSKSKQLAADSAPSRPGVRTPMVIKHHFAHPLTF
ncbi:MAG: hypothetical protein ABR991_05325 [Terracidiphilus sp.]